MKNRYYTWQFATVVLLLLISGCSKQLNISEQKEIIGPYPAFHGRLIVIQPNRRWQVSIHWQAATPERGQLRLTHAATSTIIELRWRPQQIDVRDNQHRDWRRITQQQLRDYGIVLPPQQLAAILLGYPPKGFQKTKHAVWERHLHGSLIRLQWYHDKQRLIISDMLHGQRVTLIIQP